MAGNLRNQGTPPLGAMDWSLDDKRDVVTAFHKLFYDCADDTWKNIKWMGTPIQKNPLDLFIYAEILHETRPDVIIETGTADGGSVLFLASMCDGLQNGRVLTIDISERPKLPFHPRITYLTSNSVGQYAIDYARSFIEYEATKYDVIGSDPIKQRVMVILDSDHSKDHVLKEMELYGQLVTPGCYMIVEDGNLHGHPVWLEYGPGPMEAIAAYLCKHSEFVIDKSREKLMLTFNPNGYLRRIE